MSFALQVLYKVRYGYFILLTLSLILYVGSDIAIFTSDISLLDPSKVFISQYSTSDQQRFVFVINNSTVPNSTVIEDFNDQYNSDLQLSIDSTIIVPGSLPQSFLYGIPLFPCPTVSQVWLIIMLYMFVRL
jgi:hypothetical protein